MIKKTPTIGQRRMIKRFVWRSRPLPLVPPTEAAAYFKAAGNYDDFDLSNRDTFIARLHWISVIQEWVELQVDYEGPPAGWEDVALVADTQARSK